MIHFDSAVSLSSIDMYCNLQQKKYNGLFYRKSLYVHVCSHPVLVTSVILQLNDSEVVCIHVSRPPQKQLSVRVGGLHNKLTHSFYF